MVGTALRRRRQFLRYRQLLCRRRVGDDAGRGAEGQAARRRRRLQGFQSDGRPAEQFGHVAAAHQAAVEDSLRRLQTDYIDVYYIHHVDIQTPLEEMLRAFDDLVRQGKILYTACSNYEAWRLMEVAVAQRHKRLGALRRLPAAIQPGGARHRRGDRAGLPGQGPGSGRVVAARRRLSRRQVQARQPEAEGTRSAEGWGFNSRFFAPNHDEILQSCWTRARDQPLAGADRAALGDGPAPSPAPSSARATPSSSARRWVQAAGACPAALGSSTRCRPSRTAIRAPSRNRWPHGATRLCALPRP